MEKSREQALVEAFQALRHEQFDWGDGNCGLTAAALAEPMLGRDLGSEYRPLCGSALASMRLLRAKGGFPGIMRELGCVEVPRALARRGDFVSVEWDKRGKTYEAMGVLIDYRAAFSGPSGLTLVELSRCAKAWRVEE